MLEVLGPLHYKQEHGAGMKNAHAFAKAGSRLEHRFRRCT